MWRAWRPFDADAAAWLSAVADVNNAPTGSVTISGTATQGSTLTASNTLADADGMGTVSYQWKAGGVDISGATGSTYTLTQAEVGKAITVTANYTDGGGTVESVTSAGTAAVTNINDAPTGSVTISGTAVQGQTLTASNTLADADGLGTISYQWKAGGVAISGATGSTYTLTQAEVGKAITVTASYTDGGGTAESSTSSATAVVELDPLLLFASGESGAWIEPSIGLMYQDYTGLVPVTAGAQPVGLMLDKSKALALGAELFADASVVLGGPAGYAERLSPGVYRCYRDAGGLGTVQIASGLTIGRAYRITVTLSPYSGSDPDVTASRGTVQFGATSVYDSATNIANITTPQVLSLTVVATATTLRVICSATGTGINISGLSVRELAGNHARQSVSNSRPLYMTSQDRLVFDGIDDGLTITFPAALGACTIVASVPGVGAQILTNQTVGTSWGGSVTHCGRIIINRPLTASETVGVTRWANRRAGV